MFKHFIITTIALAFVITLSLESKDKVPAVAKASNTAITTKIDTISYGIGANIGRNFKKDSILVNLDVFMAGFRDALGDGKLALTDEEIQQSLMTFQKEMQEKQQRIQKELSEKAKGEGKKFLDENKTKPGITTTPSGLQYEVIKSGTGKTPTAKDKVKCHYTGTLIDGTVFDSSVQRGEPIDFNVSGVIKGWTEALQLMKEGDKWKLYIPSELAYGERGQGQTIPPNSVLIFEVELISVLAPDATQDNKTVVPKPVIKPAPPKPGK